MRNSRIFTEARRHGGKQENVAADQHDSRELAFFVYPTKIYRLTGPPSFTSNCTIESIAARIFAEVSL